MSRGFILITVLILLSIISLFILTQQQLLNLHYRILGVRLANYQAQRSLYQSAKTIRGHSKTEPYCQQNATAAQAPCAIIKAQEKHPYSWKMLSEEPCLQIKKGYHGNVYQLTIEDHQSRLQLQQIIVFKGSPGQCLKGLRRLVSQTPLSTVIKPLQGTL